ncbi:MAG: lipopolysaccharide heptosyltransferase II [Hydrogenophilales bacterium]|nr:lipopolysaccharide heptosyltransferase II [Hydrogenophilales bacterium]
MTKILIIAPAWVGDAVMAQPLLMRLKQRFPDATIDAYAPPWVAPVLRRMPEISAVIDNPFTHGQQRFFDRIKAARALRAHRYDQVIVLPNSLKSALIPFFARIPLRTGYVGEFRYGLLNDARPLDASAYPLMLERFALLAEPRGQALARPVPHPRLITVETQQAATLAKLGLTLAQPVIALCPGAEYGPAKRWPEAHFAGLAQALQQRGYQIWLIGSKKDQAIGENIAQISHHACRNLCGQTSLDEAVDLLGVATSVVTNDSGLMHVAAALDKPLVAIYGSSSPGFTPPLSGKARIVSLHLPCSPCFKRECPLGHLNCLLNITPDQVLVLLETAKGPAP